jgi:hypothetical protein
MSEDTARGPLLLFAANTTKALIDAVPFQPAATSIPLAVNPAAQAPEASARLTDDIDTTTAGDPLIFHVFCALTEFEADLTRERTMAGLAGARN